MNKDAILATLIGFGIGLIITGLLLLGPSLVQRLPKITLPTITWFQNTNTQVTPTPTPAIAEGLTIESPLPESIEHTATLLVSGTARSQSTVVIAGYNDETVVTATADGKFAGKITLSEGINEIIVTQLTASETTSKTVTVYYTEETL